MDCKGWAPYNNNHDINQPFWLLVYPSNHLFALRGMLVTLYGPQHKRTYIPPPVTLHLMYGRKQARMPSEPSEIMLWLPHPQLTTLQKHVSTLVEIWRTLKFVYRTRWGTSQDIRRNYVIRSSMRTSMVRSRNSTDPVLGRFELLPNYQVQLIEFKIPRPANIALRYILTG